LSVSIIIPTFNSAEWLPATIRSALSQTTPPTDILVIDDGSTDATTEICRSFEGKISYEKIQNSGVSLARNRGADQSQSEWLLFLDSDDVLFPCAIETLLATARQSASRVAYGHVLQRGKTPFDNRLNGYPYAIGEAPIPALRNFWRSAIITPGSAIVQRSLHHEIGGFVSGYEPMEDRDYWVKCGALSSFGFSTSCVLDKTWRESSAGTQSSKRILNGMRAQEAFLGWCGERNIDSSFLKTTPIQIIEHAIKSALFEKRHDILSTLLAIATQRKMRGYWFWRAQAEHFFRGQK